MKIIQDALIGKLFVLDPSQQEVRLEPLRLRDLIVDAECAQIELLFFSLEIISDILGVTRQSLSVPVEYDPMSQYEDDLSIFAGIEAEEKE